MSITSVNARADDDLDLSYFLNILDGTISQKDMVVIMTTNHLEMLDPAIYRAGRMDLILNLKLCDHHQIREIYRRIIKREIDVNVLNKIPIDTYTPAKIIFHLIKYIGSEMSDDEIMATLIN